MIPCGPLNLSLAGEATTCTAPGASNASGGPLSDLAGASPALPIFSMTLGAVSNVLALALLAQVAGRLRRRRSAATFLLFVASLLATDLVGHVIDPDPEGQAAVHCPPTPGQFSRAEGAVEEVVPWRRVPRSQAEALPE